MSTTDSNTTAAKIYSSHEPALKDGYYKVNVTQQFKADSNNDSYDTVLEEVSFKVAGEQYLIAPQHIDSVYPPEKAHGDFTNILPHIILNRSTLPWERSAFATDADHPVTPWLALLVFTEDELISDSIAFKANSDDHFTTISINPAKWGGTDVLDTNINTDNNIQPITLLLIGKKLLDAIKPAALTDTVFNNEMVCLTHVRGGKGDEKAVIIAGRMPVKDKKNIVHLVSMEARLDDSGNINGKCNTETTAEGFISLYRWEFFCNDHFVVTPEILEKYAPTAANGETTVDPIPFSSEMYEALQSIGGSEFFDLDDFINAIPLKNANGDIAVLSDQVLIDRLVSIFEVAHLNQILTHIDRTPAGLQSVVNGDLSLAGYVKMKYSLSDGNSIDSIYRGPLIPKSDRQTNGIGYGIPKSLLCADSLFRFVGDDFVDVSYAAAWELGRLLALKDKNFSVALFQWKRSCYQQYKTMQKKNLTVNESKFYFPPMPAFVRTWFDDLILLKNIPFHYLVPTEAFLPFESLRFFTIDQDWIKYLFDGAYSIARLSKKDSDIDDLIYSNQNLLVSGLKTPNAGNTQSGFLLRSRAVSGWPNLIIEGTTLSDQLVDMFISKPAPNLMFCQFAADVVKISIYQKPESIHFGFEENDDNPLTLYADKIVTTDQTKVTVTYDSQYQKVDIGDLYRKAKALDGSLCAASFAVILVQEIEKMNFPVTLS